MTTIHSTIGDAADKSIVMFDLDGTLVKTKSGNIIPRTSGDWMWMPRVIDTLIELAKDDITIIIVTNQKYVTSPDKNTVINKKLKNIFKALCELLPAGTRIHMFAAHNEDKYRKPSTGIFEDLVVPLNARMNKIIYVGDAAGRAKDFSDSDRKFAYNVQLYIKYAKIRGSVMFYTPEEYFMHEGVSDRTWSGFDPRAYLDNVTYTSDIELPNQGSLVVLVGAPASGKTTFSQRLYELNFTVLRLDDMPRKKNYDSVFQQATSANGTVVDATNPDVESRARWLKFADKFKHVYIYVFDSTDEDYLHHMNVYRSRVTEGIQIPKIAYRMFNKKYTEPTESECPGAQIMYVPKYRRISFPDKKNLTYFLQRS